VLNASIEVGAVMTYPISTIERLRAEKLRSMYRVWGAVPCTLTLTRTEIIMTDRKALVQAWFSWRRLVPPVEDFNRGKHTSPTFDLECGIDHLRTSVYGLASGFMGGKHWDFPSLTESRFAELQRLQFLVMSSSCEESRKARYSEYLDAIQRVLQELRAVDGAPRNEAEHNGSIQR
jgi:hypothetical protein